MNHLLGSGNCGLRTRYAFSHSKTENYELSLCLKSSSRLSAAARAPPCFSWFNPVLVFSHTPLLWLPPQHSHQHHCHRGFVRAPLPGDVRAPCVPCFLMEVTLFCRKALSQQGTDAGRTAVLGLSWVCLLQNPRDATLCPNLWPFLNLGEEGALELRMGTG